MIRRAGAGGAAEPFAKENRAACRSGRVPFVVMV